MAGCTRVAHNLQFTTWGLVYILWGWPVSGAVQVFVYAVHTHPNCECHVYMGWLMGVKQRLLQETAVEPTMYSTVFSYSRYTGKGPELVKRFCTLDIDNCAHWLIRFTTKRVVCMYELGTVLEVAPQPWAIVNATCRP